MRILLFLLPLTLFAGGYEEPWGRDADMIHKKKEKITERRANGAMKVANSVISFHQKVLSPTTGPRSSYRPTSSKYMELAIKRYGFLRGYVMGCDRLLRENDEAWVYRTVQVGNIPYKYDPAHIDKYHVSPR